MANIVYNDLNESNYTFKYDDLVFYFSSQFYQEKFTREYSQFLKDETMKKRLFHVLEEEYSKLTDTELQNKTEEFKERLNKGETLEDILVEAVESGAWDVNVYPVCEKFPCTKEEFSGAWEDRFSYEYIANQYDLAKKTGRLDSFYQELMLRIISDDTKLVHPNEIRWYKKSVLLQSKSFYNFYITTDFATSAKQSADYSVISVWAINSNGDYFWVDGQCKRTTMNNTIDKLFELVSKYKPQSVGIEVTGQQGAFIQWLQKEMMQRNIFFSFASSGNNNAPGIRPVADKLSRFNLVVPMFKAGKFWFPEEDKDNPILKEGLQEINLATSDGLKGKDDFLDTISMLAYIKVWRPSESVPYINPENDTGLYDEDMLPIDDSTERMDSYIV